VHGAEQGGVEEPVVAKDFLADTVARNGLHHVYHLFDKYR
jgi:hypothetical protein